MFFTGDTKYIYPDEILELEQVVSIKDVTFGAARVIAGGKAGMDDNSERGTLFFDPSNKGESLSSLFLIPMYQFWLHIYIYRIFVTYVTGSRKRDHFADFFKIDFLLR